MSTRARVLSQAVGLVWALGLPAAAQTPLSAIDWLSESETTLPIALPLNEAENDVTSGITTEEITVTVLEDPNANAAGVLPSERTGLPKDLWQNSTSFTLEALLRRLRLSKLPALNDIGLTLLLAEARAPAGSGSGDTFLLARVDELIERGALEAAAVLLEQAGARGAALQERAFDVALLTGQEDRACEALKSEERSAPSYPLRVFCLARNGDWSAAALTLESARALGEVSADEDALLASFLDPEIADVTPPPLGLRPDPLLFTLYDAIGSPLATGPLPLAFAHADLRATAGWKAQLEAAERLARAGVLPANRLLGIYTERKPSASGGVWGRAKAVQALDKAIREDDDDAIAKALPRAWEAAKTAGIEIVFAVAFSEALQDADLDGEAEALALRIGLLSPQYEAIAAKAMEDEGTGNPQDRLLFALARGMEGRMEGYDPLSSALAEAWQDPKPAMDLTRLAKDRKLGEALLKTLLMLESSLAGDNTKLTAGLSFLRSIGLEDVARRAALQILILERKA